MNQLNDVEQFIKIWETGREQDDTIKKFVNISKLGNINIKGDCHSDTSVLFTKNDIFFYDSIEENIKKLVYILIQKFNWITYSSCQGHPSCNGTAYKKRIIQLLPRNDQEKQFILCQLIEAKNKYALIWVRMSGTKLRKNKSYSSSHYY